MYLISVLAGEGEDFFPAVDSINDRTVHVFTRQFVEIVLNELDTISDFVAYLRAKEALLPQLEHLIIMGGEEELLGHYLFHEHSFKDLGEGTGVFLDEGYWPRLQQRPEYQAKERANKVSYGWDFMIDRVHEGGHSEYERIAREMARSNRFERRYLSKVFFDAYEKAHADDKNDLLRRVLPIDGRTYCFLFADDPERERRRKSLIALCYVARAKFPNGPIVIGIATEKTIQEKSTFDFCLLDMPEWTAEDQRRVDTIQEATGMLANVTLGSAREEEYPAGEPEDAR